MKKKTRLQLFFINILIIVVFLAGCSEDVEPEKEPLERQNLVVWTYYEVEAQIKGLELLVQKFNDSQSEYELSWEYVPATEFDKRLSRAYTEHELPDLVILDNPDMPRFIQLGMFEDITEYVKPWNMEQEYYKAPVDTVTYKGHYYGVPFTCNNVGLIYNKTMLKDAEITPPATWEELKEAAMVLTTDTCNGFLMCGFNGEQGAFQILPWILSTGEAIDTLGSEKTQKAYIYLDELMKAGSLSADCINMSQVDLARKFVAKEAAMIENGPWVFPILDESGIDYGIVPLPIDQKHSVVSGGENLGIIKGKNVEGSISFIQFCMGSGYLEEFCEISNMLPAKISIAKQMAKENEKLQVIEEQMHTAITRTSISGWTKMSSAISNAFYKMVSGELTPEEAGLSIGKSNE